MTAVEKQILGYLSEESFLCYVRNRLIEISVAIKNFKEYANFIAEEVKYTSQDLPKTVAAVRKRFHIMENKDFCIGIVEAYSEFAADYTQKSIEKLNKSFEKKPAQKELTDICNLQLLKLAAAFEASANCMIEPISVLVDENLNKTCNRHEAKMFSVYTECVDKILRVYRDIIKAL